MRKQIFQEKTEISVLTRLKFSILKLYEHRLLEMTNMKRHAQIRWGNIVYQGCQIVSLTSLNQPLLLIKTFKVKPYVQDNQISD